jgi:hypothetical protein
MTNSKYAFPSIKVQCRDRVREFCLNVGAFCALEKYMEEQTGNSEYSAATDFPWDSTKMETVALMLWAGFYEDAKKDKTPWTLDLAKSNIDFITISQVRGLIQASLARILTPEQLKGAKLESKTDKKKQVVKTKKKKLIG